MCRVLRYPGPSPPPLRRAGSGGWPGCAAERRLIVPARASEFEPVQECVIVARGDQLVRRPLLLDVTWLLAQVRDRGKELLEIEGPLPQVGVARLVGDDILEVEA